MHPFWQSKIGQVFIGGCGSQIGLLLTCSGMVAVLSLCAICASSNVLTIGVAQQLQVAEASTSVPVEVSPSTSSDEVNILFEEVTSLLGEIESFQSEASAFALPAASPASFLAKPMAIADRGVVELRSGPGADYNQAGVLLSGESLEIVGRNANSTWWLVSTPNGLFAWVADAAVAIISVDDSVPVVTIPSLLAQPVSSNSLSAVTVTPSASPTSTPTPTITPTPTLPPGTATPSAEAERIAAPDTVGYKALTRQLLVPPVSLSFSPDGGQIAITERIKVYTVAADGGSGRIWLEEDDTMGPIGGAVWSPDGKQIAFVVGFKHKYCRPCRAVALLTLEDETIEFLTPPEEHLDTDMPRWTQGGRLLVNAHPGEPADGVAYVYDQFGQIQAAHGNYTLSSSHEGQKWYPWKSGRIWRAGVSERADSYNSD